MNRIKMKSHLFGLYTINCTSRKCSTRKPLFYWFDSNDENCYKRTIQCAPKNETIDFQKLFYKIITHLICGLETNDCSCGDCSGSWKCVLWMLTAVDDVYLGVRDRTLLYFDSIDLREAIARKRRLPKKNVMRPSGTSNRRVSNMFNCSQKIPNSPKMPPNPRWKPRALKLIGKLETFTPNLIHRRNKMSSGATQRPVKTSETTRDGRFSGSRNWWMISGRGALVLLLSRETEMEMGINERILYKTCV